MKIGRINSLSQARRLEIQLPAKINELDYKIKDLKSKHVEEINRITRLCLELEAEIAKKDEEIKNLKNKMGILTLDK